MRFAGNFHPEWGYLAPAPSFLRTARIVVVATAIGATAGAGVVFSLVGRPAAEAGKTSVAARTLVQPVGQAGLLAPQFRAPAAPAASPPIDAKARAQAAAHTTAQAAQDAAQDQDRLQKSSAAMGHIAVGVATSDSSAKSTSPQPTGLGTLAEVPAAGVPAPAKVYDPPAKARTAPVAARSAKKAIRQHRDASRGHATRDGWRRPQSAGVDKELSFLRHLFDYAPQGEYFANEGSRGYPRGDRLDWDR